MIVWRGDRETPIEEIRRYYPDAVREGSRTFAYQTSGSIPDVTVNWVIIPPGKVVFEPAN